MDVSQEVKTSELRSRCRVRFTTKAKRKVKLTWFKASLSLNLSLVVHCTVSSHHTLYSKATDAL